MNWAVGESLARRKERKRNEVRVGKEEVRADWTAKSRHEGPRSGNEEGKEGSRREVWVGGEKFGRDLGKERSPKRE